MNDTRAKLETLFRRLVDPAVSDLEALSDFVWFRKLALDAKDVQDALGTPPGAPVNAFAVVPGACHAPSEASPEYKALLARDASFGKYSAKKRPDGVAWAWGRVLREDRKWLEHMETWEKSQPWMVQIVREVLGKVPPTTKPSRDAGHLRQAVEAKEAQNQINAGNPSADDEPPF